MLQREYKEWQYLFNSNVNKVETVVVLATMLSTVFTTDTDAFTKEKMAQVQRMTKLSTSTCKKLFQSMVAVLNKVEDDLSDDSDEQLMEMEGRINH